MFPERIQARRLGFVSIVLLASAGLAAACAVTEPVELLTQVFAQPDLADLEADETQRFSAYALTNLGDTLPADVDWSASRGTVTTDGLFTPPDADIEVTVVATSKPNPRLTGKARVMVRRALSAVVVSPSGADLEPGGRQQFGAYGMRTIDSTDVTVSYAAAGGTITPEGLYTAGTTPGAYRVVATAIRQRPEQRPLADTATVVIRRIPILEAVVLAPASAELEAGTQQQFHSYGRTTDGDSVDVPATYGASGGTITEDGLYTAPQAAGTYSVFVSDDGDALADTSQVIVTAVSGNQAPVATITQPTAGASFVEGAAVQFRGSATDAEDGAITGKALVWRSDRDGQLGTGKNLSRDNLSVGSHVVSLVATDASGASNAATVALTITANLPPTASITSPAGGASYRQGDPIAFEGSGSDPEDGSLTGGSLAWTSDREGALGTGSTFARSDLSVGSHQITLTATDQNGATGLATIALTVTALPNQPPTASITSPGDGDSYLSGDPITFGGSGSDPEDGSLTGGSLVWTSDRDGALGTGLTFSRSNLSVGVHNVTLTATDSQGATGKSGVALTVTAPPPPPPPPPPPSGAVADPTSLPVASSQGPNSSAYSALNVPGLPAGGSYTDPTTGVKVYKVTSASVPFNNERSVPDYSEGGAQISLPWGANGDQYTLYVQVRQSGGPSSHYFVDFNISAGAFTNWRAAPVENRELQWSWSNNPATPRIGFYVGGPSLRHISRYDTGTMRDANTGNFPHATGAATDLEWLHQDKNDEWFVALVRNGADMVAWNSVTDVQRTRRPAGSYDEPHLDRSGQYAANITRFSGDPVNGIELLRLSNGAVSDPREGSQHFYASHVGSLDGYFVFLQTDQGDEYRFDPATGTHTRLYTGSYLHGGSGHRSGQWVVSNGQGPQQWYVLSVWGGGSGAADQAIVFLRANGDSPRLLAHHYSSVSTDYYTQPHATISPDGRLVMWGSNMLGSRLDAFLAVVPAR